MHKIRSSLTEHQRPHTSMSYKYPREVSLREFVPFSKERDNLGRLIRPAVSEHFQQGEAKKTYQIQTEGKEMSPNVIHSKMEDKMSKYFKQTGLSNLTAELNKNKIIKKKSLINILFNDPKAPKNSSRISHQNIKESFPLKVKEMQLAQTEWSPSKPGTQQGIRRMKSSLIPRCRSSMSPIKPTRRSDENTLNHRQSLPNARQHLNLQRYQQLNMYHKRQQLQIKMQTTFEQGHLRFIDKMKASKKLAYELKYNLDQIDNYC